MARRKFLKIRGGMSPGLSHRLGDASKYMRTAGRLYKQYKKHIMSAAAKVNPQLPMVLNLGEKIAHGLYSKSAGAGTKNLGLPIFGAEVRSPGTGGTSETNYKAKHRGSKIMKSVLNAASRFEIITGSNYRLSASTGFQNYGDMTNGAAVATQNPGFAAAIYNGNGSTANGVTTYQGILTQAQYTALGQSTTTPVYATGRVYHKYCEVETMISSESFYPIVIDIYEVVAKHDLTGSPQVAGNSLTGLSIYSPAAYWNYGLSNTQGSVAALAATNLGSNPYDSELFNTYWKVCSKVTVMMSAGDMHRHVSHYHMNKFVDSQRAFYSSMLQGTTRNIMVVVRGTPVADSVTNTKVGYGPAVVNVTHTLSYKFAAIPANSLVTSYVNYTPVVTTAKTTVTDGATATTTLTN